MCTLLANLAFSNSEQTVVLLFNSAQFKMVSAHLEKPICAPPCLRSFPNVAFEMVPVFIRLMMALSLSFQGSSLSSSSFPASLLQVVDGVMSLALFPPASASSSSTLKIFWDASRLWWLLCLPDCLLGHFPFTSACPGQYIHGSLQVILQEKWDFTKRKVENIEEGEGRKRNEFVFPFRCHSIIQF